MRSFYFFGYDSKLLRLGINEQVMSFLGHVSTCWSFCNLAGASAAQLELLQLLQKLFAASAGAISASAEAITASAGAVIACVEAIAASAGAVFGVFG